MHMHSSFQRKSTQSADWPLLPNVQLSPEKVQEFRAILERALGTSLNEDDETIRQWAVEAIQLAHVLREVSRRAVARRQKPSG
jgi:hypothetical protein